MASADSTTFSRYVVKPSGDAPITVTRGRTAPSPHPRHSPSESQSPSPTSLPTQPVVAMEASASDPYAKGMFRTIQGFPSPDDDSPCIPIIVEPDEPVGTVNCATTASPAGPSGGCNQNTAPSDDEIGVTCDQLSKSMPTVPRALWSSPSVKPTVNQESRCEAAPPASQSDGLVPPTCAPKGSGAWKAAGTASGDAAVPKIE